MPGLNTFWWLSYFLILSVDIRWFKGFLIKLGEFFVFGCGNSNCWNWINTHIVSNVNNGIVLPAQHHHVAHWILFTFLIEKGRGVWSYFFLFYSFILVVVDWLLIFNFLLLLLILRLLNKNMIWILLSYFVLVL